MVKLLPHFIPGAYSVGGWGKVDFFNFGFYPLFHSLPSAHCPDSWSLVWSEVVDCDDRWRSTQPSSSLPATQSWLSPPRQSSALHTDISLLHSHWSSSLETVLWLVEIMMLHHKEQVKAPKARNAPERGQFGPKPLVGHQHIVSLGGVIWSIDITSRSQDTRPELGTLTWAVSLWHKTMIKIQPMRAKPRRTSTNESEELWWWSQQ